MDHLAIPAAGIRNGIGLGNGKPALDIGDVPALDVAGVDMAAIQLSGQRAHL